MQQTRTSSDSDATRPAVRDALRRAVGRLRRGRTDERGLTTLEWLLIVAAVAGLAALAVVLVQNVVDETAEDISGQSARGTSARVAAERITREARAALPVGMAIPMDSGTTTAAADYRAAQTEVNTRYGAACDRLEINYGDIDGFSANWMGAEVASGAAGDAVTVPGGATTDGSTRLLDSAGTSWDATVAPLPLDEATCETNL